MVAQPAPRTKVFINTKHAIGSEDAALRTYFEIPNARVLEYKTDSESLLDTVSFEISAYGDGEWSKYGPFGTEPTKDLLPFEFADTSVADFFKQRHCLVFMSRGWGDDATKADGKVDPYKLIHTGYTNAGNLSFNQEGSTINVVSRLEPMNWATYKSDLVEYVFGYQVENDIHDRHDRGGTSPFGRKYGKDIRFRSHEFVLNPTFNGQVVGNCLDVGDVVMDYPEGMPLYCPIYLDPANFTYWNPSIGKLWTVGDVIQMCLVHMRAPLERSWKTKNDTGAFDTGDVIGPGSAENYQTVKFPHVLDFYNLSTATRSKDLIRNFKFKLGDRWVDILNRVLKPNNLMAMYDYSDASMLGPARRDPAIKAAPEDVYLDTAAEYANEYKPAFKIIDKSSTKTFSINHQARDSDVDMSQSFITSFDFNYDLHRNSQNAVFATGGPEIIEFTAELIPGWHTKFDSLSSNFNDKKLKLGSKEMEEAGSHFAWRRWVLNENGDHYNERTKIGLTDVPFQWTDLSFLDKDGAGGICSGRMRRYKFEPVLLRHKNGGGVAGPHGGCLVEWHNGDGKWKNISGGTDPDNKYNALQQGRSVKILDSECGIMFTGETPPPAIVRAGMEEGDTLNTKARIRITASVTFDRARTYTVQPDSRDNDPIHYFTPWHAFANEVPNTRYTDYDPVAGTTYAMKYGDNYGSPYYVVPKGIAAPRYIVRGRDASSVYNGFDPDIYEDLSVGAGSDLNSYGDALWRAHFGAHGSGRITIALIYGADWQRVGYSLTSITGINLGTALTHPDHIKEKKYPVVTGMRLDFVKSQTELTLGDPRARLK